VSRAVEVVSGSRGAGETVAPAALDAPKAAYKAARESGAKVYISRGRNLLVSIRMVQPRFDDQGRQVSFPSVKARFNGHRYETAEPEKIAGLEKCSGFGLGKDFWLLEDERKQAAIKTAESFAKAVETLDLSQIPPALLEKIRGGLGATIKPEFDAKA
jgi:hypothetical protein